MIICDNCGSTLEVANDTRFVICNQCQTALEIHRKANSIFTTKKDKVSLQNNYSALQTAADKAFAIHQLVEKIASLDRAWANEIPNHQLNNGSLPKYWDFIFPVTFFLLILAAMGAILAKTPLPLAYAAPLFGLAAFRFFQQGDYETKKKKYEKAREKLNKELKELQS